VTAGGGTGLSLDDVLSAAERLAGVATHTPVLTSRTLNREAGASVFVKAECFQRGGAFKFRGAYHRISSMAPEALARGVAAYSSGNHAQAVALAAGLLGTSAVIVMPADAPPEKLAATRGYGAEVVLYDRYRDDREALGAALANERGLTLVPPYEDLAVMAGQGTAALELVREVDGLDALVVPMGGGGLMAGSAAAAKGLVPRIRVVGVEPEAGDDHRRSFAEGHRVALPEVPRTIADGLQATTPGERTFEINRRLVDEVRTVTDGEIVGAMAFLFERMKVVVEPSGAVGVAAVLAGRDLGPRVGVIVSGGNVSAVRFAGLLRREPG
jgi:threo-3-hydroxy-L-aspartate ammonia-lyase